MVKGGVGVGVTIMGSMVVVASFVTSNISGM